MRITATILLAAATLAPGLCHAQAQTASKCPWFSEATASGVLGGAVTATTKLGEHHDGVCEFSRQQGAIALQIRISVTVMTDVHKQFPMYLAQCRDKATPLKAIGNEAVMCSVHGAQYVERVVGRVRDQAFVVDLNSTVSDDASMSQEMRRDKLQLVAEQVAGILF